jgi:dihydrodipicolinate synthase/N-acetylneuraminate lyase
MADAPSAPLAGVLPALVTPLDPEGSLDRKGLARLADRVLAAPVAGISPCGSTGEGPLLSTATRLAVVEVLAERVAPDQWLVPGVPAPNAEAALAEIAAHARAGAHAALLPPPWYFPLRAAEVAGFYRRVADDSAVPVVIYNIPAMTKVVVPVEVVAELAGHPNVIGMKDSSRDFEYLNTIVAATAGAGLSVLTGTDTLLAASVAAGAAGTIAASVNVVPDLACTVQRLAAAGEAEGARREQRRLTAVVEAVRRFGVPRAWKAALAALGVCGPHTAPPLQPTGPAEVEALATELRALGVR